MGCLGGAPQAALGAEDGELSGNTVHPVAAGADGADIHALLEGGAIAFFSAVSQGSKSGKGVLKFGWEVGRELLTELLDDLAEEDDR